MNYYMVRTLIISVATIQYTEYVYMCMRMYPYDLKTIFT